jgi:hypothetical protein
MHYISAINEVETKNKIKFPIKFSVYIIMPNLVQEFSGLRE